MESPLNQIVYVKWGLRPLSGLHAVYIQKAVWDMRPGDPKTVSSCPAMRLISSHMDLRKGSISEGPDGPSTRRTHLGG